MNSTSASAVSAERCNTSIIRVLKTASQTKTSNMLLAGYKHATQQARHKTGMSALLMKQEVAADPSI